MSSLFQVWDEAKYGREANRVHHQVGRLKQYQVRLASDVDALSSIVPDNVRMALYDEALQHYPAADVLLLTEKLTDLSNQGRVASEEYRYFSLLKESGVAQRINERLSYYARQLREHLPDIAPIA